MPYADVRVYVEKATWLYLADYDKLTWNDSHLSSRSKPNTNVQALQGNLGISIKASEGATNLAGHRNKWTDHIELEHNT